MKKVLVTGAAGFIANNLIEELLKKGYCVVGMDKEFNQERQNLSVPNGSKIFKLSSNVISKNYTFIWDDINNINHYYYVLDNIDTVYHLAASADIRQSLTDTLLDIRNNVIGTHSILEYMRENNVKKLVFSSSSAIYGENPPIPTPEDVGNIKPISLYGASKLANEAFISAYCSLYDMKAWVFRFANVIGKYQHRGVIHDFCDKIKKKPNVLEILGNGQQRKSYFDVDDVVRALLEIPKNCPLVNTSEVFNLGNKETITIKELADIVCNEIGVKPIYTYTGGDRGWVGDAPFTVLSIKKAQKFGWKPTLNCKKAIIKTVGLMKNEH